MNYILHMMIKLFLLQQLKDELNGFVFTKFNLVININRKIKISKNKIQNVIYLIVI